MRVMRTMNDQIEYQDIQPEHLKQFKRRGWLEAPDNKKSEIQPEIKQEPVRIPESEVKLKTGNPLIPNYAEMTRAKLIEYAVANGMAKGKASQSKKEDLLTFLNS